MAHQWSPFIPSYPPHQSIIFTANHGSLSKHELAFVTYLLKNPQKVQHCLEIKMACLEVKVACLEVKMACLEVIARHAKPLQMINEGSSWLLIFMPIFLLSLCPLPT